MLSVSAVCQDFPNHFQIIEVLEVPGGVKKEICNYLLWGLGFGWYLLTLIIY
jgi:hypothetical protein